ncbi:hypothetical protein QZH41_009115 [Actinostola sp. cb2023]|nr:hypothetical protein QZH41_009115 [Actinostola sp. cb2023]
MGFSCNMCAGNLMVTFALLLNHFQRVHGQDREFNVVCGIYGCGQTYQNFYGYRSHIQRKHKGVWENAKNITHFDIDQAQNVSNEEVSDHGNQVQPQEIEHHDICDDADSMCSDTTDNYQYSFKCASYILRVKETYNLTQKAVNDIIINTETLVREAIQAVCQTIKDQVSTANEEVANQVGWDAFSGGNSGIANPFQGMKSTTNQRRTFKEMFGFVEPVKRVVGRYHGHRQKGAKRRRVQLAHEVIDVPFLSSLEQMLNDPSILRQVENPHLRQDGLISDYCDGYAFSQHPLFSRDPQALQIILYYDEVEVVNPLGSKTYTHKVGVFYYTLGNIDPKYRSQLKCMQLLCIAKRPVIKKYGTNVMLESFMDDLGELEKDAGHQFTVKGEMKSFAGTVVYFSGDNLASQEVGEFKIGSASALKCRECMHGEC